MDEIIYAPIGIVHSPFKKMSEAPRQAHLAADTAATVEIFSVYEEGLKGIQECSKIVIVSHLHLSEDDSLTAKPPHDNRERGVFATRAPNRPNPIGISVAELVRVDKNVLHIKGIDLVDGTPVLDVKPYLNEADP